MDTLLQSVTLYEPSHSLHQTVVDIRVVDGTIKQIAKKIKPLSSDSIENLKGLYVSFGWFDPEVNFSEPGYESKGRFIDDLNAAASCGYTTLGIMPHTLPFPNSGSALSFYKGFSDHAVQVHPFGTLTQDANGTELSELYDLQKAGALGFYDYKKPLVESNLLKLALQYSKGFNGKIVVYPQDASMCKGGQLRESPLNLSLGLKSIPDLSEYLAVQLCIELLRYTNASLHLTGISTAETLPLIKKAKKEGLNLSCSTTVGLLYYDEKELQAFDTRYKLAPGLTDQKTRNALKNALISGVIDYVTSDHSNVSVEEKDVEFSDAVFGSRSLDSLFPALCDLFGLEKAIELLKRPYATYGLGKAEIKEGNNAQLSFFKAQKHRIQERENQTHLFHNQEFTYNGVGVFSKGQLMVSLYL